MIVGALFGATPAMAKYASIVVNAETGKVHHAVNADTRNYPASLTKMMTLYLLFEALDRRKLKLSSRFTVSRQAANQPATRLGLRPGQKIRVEDAILALIIKSANDVAKTVAENLARSERRFALIMTDKARRIGMARTTFRNASGLPHRGQMSTARDMATLARRIIADFPQYYHYFQSRKFTFQGHTHRTHNNVLTQYAGAEGMKTGYIRASGFNLVTAANRNGRRLIGVVFGGNSARSRDQHMKDLLDRGFANYRRPLRAARKMPVRPPRQSRTNSGRVKRNIWGVQVGAYYSKQPALTVARDISLRYAKILGGGRIAVMPLQKSPQRILYRARIVGIARRNAYRTCRLMKRHKKPCLEIQIRTKVEVATAPGG